MVWINVEVPSELHIALKRKALEKGLFLKDYLREVLREAAVKDNG